jgi:hypothetical protein
MSAGDRRQRALARRNSAVIRKGVLGPREHDVSPLRGAAAVSLVTQLTRESWAIAGKGLPQYTRNAIPVRFVPGRLA